MTVGFVIESKLTINWLPDLSADSLKNLLLQHRQHYAARLVANECPVELPKNLWRALLEMAKIPSDLRWSTLSKQHMQDLLQSLQANTFRINGKSTYKDEFVTCGGVKLQEVDFKTMESKKCAGLYFPGEVLNIDGVTGGFNFQNAWTTSWIAGNAIANQC